MGRGGGEVIGKPVFESFGFGLEGIWVIFLVIFIQGEACKGENTLALSLVRFVIHISPSSRHDAFIGDGFLNASIGYSSPRPPPPHSLGHPPSARFQGLWRGAFSKNFA